MRALPGCQRAGTPLDVKALSDESRRPSVEAIKRIFAIFEQPVPVVEVGWDLESPVIVAQKAVQG